MATKIKSRTKTKVQPIPTFDEALSYYYKLKGEYDAKRTKAVKNIISNLCQLLSEELERLGNTIKFRESRQLEFPCK